ncbi:mycofactocin biosynthesis peptidyl-dipeptidase MftE [Jatrophihabitans fulvus]
MTLLADLSWPDVRDRAGAGATLAVPLGSTEQHGPHLPLSTDADLAWALCRALATQRHDVLVAPALPYGASGEHQAFAGTLSIGLDALEHVLVELGRSAGETFAHVLFVSAHGGNGEAVRRAVATLRDEGRDVALYEPRWTGDPHAGHTETSLLLHLRPAAVDVERAERGDVRPLPEVLPLLREGGVAAVSPNGVLGDPTGANADSGAQVHDALVAALVAQVAAWRDGA